MGPLSPLHCPEDFQKYLNNIQDSWEPLNASDLCPLKAKLDDIQRLMKIDEYKKDYAKSLMTDDRVYDAMAGDIYGQGKVLALNKYRFLKWSYMSFLWGMFAAIIVFLLQGQVGTFIVDNIPIPALLR